MLKFDHTPSPKKTYKEEKNYPAISKKITSGESGQKTRSTMKLKM